MRASTFAVGGLLMLASFAPSPASALTIGFYDVTRENWGFSDSGVNTGVPYLSEAKQWLIDEGHTLVSTDFADAAFLSGVDAFYTGLLDTGYAMEELEAFQSFVDDDGGFLFIQTDWAVGTWTASANTILANWGISHGGNLFGGTHTTVGSSDWVTSPNIVTTFTGSQYSVVQSAPADFEVLGVDSLNRTVLGVFDAGAGRSSDVLIATDINFWDDGFGWNVQANRDLWENIWTGVADQVDPPVPGTVPEPTTLVLVGLGALGMRVARRRNASN